MLKNCSTFAISSHKCNGCSLTICHQNIGHLVFCHQNIYMFLKSLSVDQPLSCHLLKILDIEKTVFYISSGLLWVTSFKKWLKIENSSEWCLIWSLVMPFRGNIFSERKQFNQRKDFLSTNNLFTSVSSLKCSTILKSPQNCISNIQREIWWPKNN